MFKILIASAVFALATTAAHAENPNVSTPENLRFNTEAGQPAPAVDATQSYGVSTEYGAPQIRLNAGDTNHADYVRDGTRPAWAGD